MATEKRLIDKLPTGSTSKDGIWWDKHPTREDVVKKIDEIIEVLNTLLEEPTVDAVEVVRCKDCRYYNDDGEYCGNWGAVRHPEHFCGEGARE